MGQRLNWLFYILIYLSLNGQVFATAIHLCSEMAITSNALSSLNKTVNIHDHHHDSEHQEKAEIPESKHANHDSKTMDNCHCIDCDCMQDYTGEANSSLVQDINISGFLPVISKVTKSLIQNFISQTRSNPYRPPIFA
ncbi:hypothetical protein [Pseudoalteromonas sp. S554]|uniref:hypothetical protein n=1 Tax=Pseudoalteromonas sp. S554 TaxID=2066516 RepID=UPI00110D06AC|nr:hypothetical protein [Pseudoalteromonas sp. S554]TMS81984.1 hypothetical protein CWB65_07390 [Pseudoalteromonas sp. S554]